ncbi:MAG: prepilin-type N-terminal cleavage/methylation domain-containing protein [Clostridia bacterium]|nr:prepilin-type N-terminal cleavage/methylation domain-containing protein [Clostridia bacterium]
MLLEIFKRKAKNKKGFTLTELIVVIAILGILATIITPSVLQYLDDAKSGADKSNAATLENAVKRLQAKGTLVLTGTGAMNQSQIVNAIHNEINPIPTCSDTSKTFVLTKSTGKVTVETKGTFTGDKVELVEAGT